MEKEKVPKNIPQMMVNNLVISRGIESLKKITQQKQIQDHDIPLYCLDKYRDSCNGLS